MAKKKSKMISTQGFVSSEDKKKKKMIVTIEKRIPHGIDCQTQLRARSMAGRHRDYSEYSTTSTKGDNTRSANKNIDPSKHP